LQPDRPLCKDCQRFQERYDRIVMTWTSEAEADQLAGSS